MFAAVHLVYDSFFLLDVSASAYVARKHLEIVWYIFIEFDCFVFFGLSIPTYDIASFRRLLEVANDMMEVILPIFVRSWNCLFLFVKPIVVLVDVVLAIPLCGLLGCVLRATGIMLMVSSIPSCMMRTTSGSTLTTRYAPSRRGGILKAFWRLIVRRRLYSVAEARKEIAPGVRVDSNLIFLSCSRLHRLCVYRKLISAIPFCPPAQLIRWIDIVMEESTC